MSHDTEQPADQQDAPGQKLPPPRRKRGFFENSLDRCGKDFSDFVTDDHLEILSVLHIIDGKMDHILGELQSLAANG